MKACINKVRFSLVSMTVATIMSASAQSTNSFFSCYGGAATAFISRDGHIPVHAKDLITIKDNSGGQTIFVSFSHVAKDSVRVYSCSDIPNGRLIFKEVTIYAWMGDQPPDSCQTNLVIQDNGTNTCVDDLRGILSGKVTDQVGSPMKDVVIKLKKSDQSVIRDTTDEFGQYTFDQLSIDSSAGSISTFPNFPSFLPMKNVPAVAFQYSIEAEDFYADYTSQVSTIDLIRMQKHILNTAPFTNKLNFIAADVDNDGNITVIDLLELRKLILLLTDRFPNNSSYKFLPKALLGSYKPGNPPAFVSTIYLRGPTTHDFIGIKIGDIVD